MGEPLPIDLDVPEVFDLLVGLEELASRWHNAAPAAGLAAWVYRQHALELREFARSHIRPTPEGTPDARS